MKKPNKDETGEIVELNIPVPYRHLLRLVEFGEEPDGEIKW